MDNEFIKNIVSQFPTLALFIASVGLIFWVVKNYLDIKKNKQSIDFGKKIEIIILSAELTQELIESLRKLRKTVSKINIEKIKLIEENTFLNEALNKLLKNLPKSWKYEKHIELENSKFNDFIESIKKEAERCAEENNNKNKTLHKIRREKKAVLLIINNIIDLSKKQKKESDHKIGRISTIKGTGFFMVLLFFFSSIFISIQLQEQLNITIQKSIQTENYNIELKKEIEELKEEKVKKYLILIDVSGSMPSVEEIIEILKSLGVGSSSHYLLFNNTFSSIVSEKELEKELMEMKGGGTDFIKATKAALKIIEVNKYEGVYILTDDGVMTNEINEFRGSLKLLGVEKLLVKRINNANK